MPREIRTPTDLPAARQADAQRRRRMAAAPAKLQAASTFQELKRALLDYLGLP